MLNDVQCKNATCPPDRKKVRLSCSGGLYLEVTPKGSKRWFYKYRKADGKETRLALGNYPNVSSKAAREARDQAKLQKAGGQDPVSVRRVAQLTKAGVAGDAFKEIALEWFDKHHVHWSSHYAIREKRNLEKDLFPYLASRQMDDIMPGELLAVIKKVEQRGALDVAHRVLITARAVWRYAVASIRAKRDITGDIAGALTPHRKKHFAAITQPERLAPLLRVIREYQGGPIVRAALQLVPMLFQRPGELRAMAWAELDLDAALWTIPSMRMKRRKAAKENGQPHLVPLPSQAVKILRDLHFLTGHGELVFPGERSHDRPISDNTLRAALQTLGYGSTVQTVHGFRATARTILTEVLEFDPLMIEAQLAHVVKDANGAAYNRATYVKQRTTMMQAWADYLDKLANSADVVPLRLVA